MPVFGGDPHRFQDGHLLIEVKVSNFETIKKLIKELSGNENMLSVPRLYMDLLGGDTTAALFLSQAVFWSDKSERKDGYFYKSYKDWRKDTGLTQYKVNRSASVCAAFVKTKKIRAKGAPTIHYKVDMDILTKSIIKFLDNRETSQSDYQETSQSDYQETSQSLTETTTKKTQKTTVKNNGPSPLEPSTEHQRLFFEKVNRNREARNYNPAKKFPTLECKEKFEKAEARLGKRMPEAINQAMMNYMSIKSYVNYISKITLNGGPKQKQATQTLSRMRERLGLEE